MTANAAYDFANTVNTIAVAAFSQANSGGSVGGSNTQVLFNDAGTMAGNVGLTYNKHTKTLFTENIAVNTALELANTLLVGTNTENVLITQNNVIFSSGLRAVKNNELELVNTKAEIVGFSYSISGGGSALTAGPKGFIEIPYNMNLTNVTVLANVSGNINVAVYRGTYNQFPNINASGMLIRSNLSLGFKTTQPTSNVLNIGEILVFNIDSVTNTNHATISFRGNKR
jgi:hypothetical protein